MEPRKAFLRVIAVAALAAFACSGCAFIDRQGQSRKTVDGKTVVEKYAEHKDVVFPFYMNDVKTFDDRIERRDHIMLLGGNTRIMILKGREGDYPWAGVEEGVTYLYKSKYVLPFYYVSDTYGEKRWDKVRWYGVYMDSESVETPRKK